MDVILFSSPSQGIVVIGNAGGSHSWSGNYGGVSIKAAIPLDNGERCILLLDPDATNRSVFENLFCIDRDGHSIWTARLPAKPDTFLDVLLDSEGLWAHTWSGYKILFDEKTGESLKTEFMK